MGRFDKEPTVLRQGKVYGKEVARSWEDTAEGIVCPERPVKKIDGATGKPTGRGGRIDIFVTLDDAPDLVAIVEVKRSNWDKMEEKRVALNVRRHSAQLWGYIDTFTHPDLPTGDKRDVSAGIVFPKRPAELDRQRRIESLFEKEGISVVWEDEPTIVRQGPARTRTLDRTPRPTREAKGRGALPEDDPPGYVLSVLGSRPTTGPERAAWDKAVTAIDDYRTRFSVTDVTALGRKRDLDPERRQARDVAERAIVDVQGRTRDRGRGR